MSLDDTTIKQLSDRHPLFSKLTGQVIWLLFEEHDASPENIDAFMDAFLTWKIEQLEVFSLLEQTARASQDGYLHIITDMPDQACATCAALHDTIIPANDEKLLTFLPPFALGCRCRASFMSQREYKERNIKPAFATKHAPPKHDLHCPSEWLFTAKWTKTTE